MKISSESVINDCNKITKNSVISFSKNNDDEHINKHRRKNKHLLILKKHVLVIINSCN